MRNVDAEIGTLGWARFLLGSLQVWSQSGLWPNLGLVQRAGLGLAAQVDDTDALPPWLRREKSMRTASRTNCHAVSSHATRIRIAV